MKIPLNYSQSTEETQEQIERFASQSWSGATYIWFIGIMFNGILSIINKLNELEKSLEKPHDN
jgi:hypothetical protein